MLNERTRAWADTQGGKQIQCQVFAKLIEIVEKKDDGKYASVGVEYLEAKTVKEINSTGQTVESVQGNGKTFSINSNECFTYALNRLAEHGLVTLANYKRAGVKLTKKGLQRWEAKNK